MELTDTHSCEELQAILNSYKTITDLLADALDLNLGIKNRIYKALADREVNVKLSEHAQMVELIRKGDNELVEEYFNSNNEVAKLKNHCKYAEHALNTKKHINNLGRV
jgi:DNA-binding GntR family transcriptional regulator